MPLPLTEILKKGAPLNAAYPTAGMGLVLDSNGNLPESVRALLPGYPDEIRLDAYDLKSWTYDPMVCVNGRAPTSQTIYLTALPLRKGHQVANAHLRVYVAATGADPTAIYMALVSTGGERLAVTADLAADTKFDSLGYKSFAFTSTYPVPTDGIYYVAFLKNGAYGGTDLQLGRSLSDANHPALNAIFEAAIQTGQATIPATVSLAAGLDALWFGVS